METDKLAWPSHRMTRMRPRLRAAPLPSTLSAFGNWIPRAETKVVRRSAAVVDANGRSSYGIGSILPMPRRSSTLGSPSALLTTSTPPSPSPRLNAALLPLAPISTSFKLPPLISARLHLLLTTLGPVWWLLGGEDGATKALIAEGGKLEFTLRLWELAAQAWQSTKNIAGDAATARSILAIATGAARGNLSGFEYGTLRNPLMAEFSRLVSQHALQLRGVLHSAAFDAEQILMAERKTSAQVATLVAERRLAEELRGRTSATSPKQHLMTAAAAATLSSPQRSPLSLSRTPGGGGGAGARYSSPLPSPTFERSPSSTPQPPDAWLWRGSENNENEDMATSEAHLKKELVSFRSQIKAAPARLPSRLPDTLQDDESLVSVAATAVASTTLRPVRPRPIPWKSPIDVNNSSTLGGPIVFAASSLSRTPHNLSTASLSSLGSITAAFSLYEASEGGGDLTPLSSTSSYNNNNNNNNNKNNNSKTTISRLSPISTVSRLSPLSQQFLGSRLLQTRLGHSHLDKLLH